MKPRISIAYKPNGNDEQSVVASTSSQRQEGQDQGQGQSRVNIDSRNCIYRIRRELDEIHQNPPPNCIADNYKNDLYRWTACINGPHGTAYEGGKFKLDIRFPKSYPFRPPQVRFNTRIYHCNVDSRGAICIDILNERWSPVMTIAKVLLSIWVLIGECNPDDPLVICIADQYLSNRKEHDRIARSWTLRYAKEQSVISSPKAKTTSNTKPMIKQQSSDETLIPEQ